MNIYEALVTYTDEHADRLTPMQAEIIAVYLLDADWITMRADLFRTGLRFSYHSKYGWLIEDMNDG